MNEKGKRQPQRAQSLFRQFPAGNARGKNAIELRPCLALRGQLKFRYGSAVISTCGEMAEWLKAAVC